MHRLQLQSVSVIAEAADEQTFNVSICQRCLSLPHQMENEMSAVVLDGLGLLVTANWKLSEKNKQSSTLNVTSI